jgi:hypothetical protein
MQTDKHLDSTGNWRDIFGNPTTPPASLREIERAIAKQRRALCEAGRRGPFPALLPCPHCGVALSARERRRHRSGRRNRRNGASERAAWMTRHLEYVLETGHLCAVESGCAVCGPLRGGGESV